MTQYVETTWITRKCGVRQRASVCSRTDQRVEPNAGNKNKVVDSVPPTDKWADKTNKLRVGAIPEVFCRL